MNLRKKGELPLSLCYRLSFRVKTVTAWVVWVWVFDAVLVVVWVWVFDAVLVVVWVWVWAWPLVVVGVGFRPHE